MKKGMNNTSNFVLSKDTAKYADMFKMLLAAEENFLALMDKLADDEALKDSFEEWNTLSADLFDCMERDVLSAMREKIKEVCGRNDTPYNVL